MSDSTKTPRVFISYSWTSGDHVSRVAELGTRLMDDGVDVVLDQWSLEDGQDVTAFMESMVSDPTIDRILVIADMSYAEKADGRSGGVGTETQIISPGIYADIKQTKVLPLIFERDADDAVCVPTFLKGRKYIDFSDPDSEEASYDRLLRNLHQAPELTKPKLGKKPAHLAKPSTVTSRSSTVAKRIRTIVESGRGNLSFAINDFAEAMEDTLEDLRILYDRQQEDTWCKTIEENIRQSLPLRDSFVEVCSTILAANNEQVAVETISDLLQQLLRYKHPKRDTGGGIFEISQDNYRFICYELFLYAVAVSIRFKAYAVAEQLMSASYLEPRDFDGDYSHNSSARAFNEHAKSINEMCAVEGNTRRTSKTGDWIKERATLRGLGFRMLCQADAVLAIHPKVYGWWPRSMILSFRESPFDLFMKAETPEGFRSLGILLGLSKPQQLVELLHSKEVQQTFGSGHHFRFGNGLAQLNAKTLSEIYGR